MSTSDLVCVWAVVGKAWAGLGKSDGKRAWKCLSPLPILFYDKSGPTGVFFFVVVVFNVKYIKLTKVFLYLGSKLLFGGEFSEPLTLMLTSLLR